MITHKQLAPAVLEFNDVIDFYKDIIKISSDNAKGWIIKTKDAVDWQLGDKILGYDEFPIDFNFSNNIKYLVLGKTIYDYVQYYSINNFTSATNFEYCMLRRYSSNPGFFELESADVENPYRKITAILFLSTLNDGGSLSFKNFDIEISPVAGKLVIFPSSFSYSFKINRPKLFENFVVISHFS